MLAIVRHVYVISFNSHNNFFLKIVFFMSGLIDTKSKLIINIY